MEQCLAIRTGIKRNAIQRNIPKYDLRKEERFEEYVQQVKEYDYKDEDKEVDEGFTAGSIAMG